jgi:hypothetical protein
MDATNGDQEKVLKIQRMAAERPIRRVPAYCIQIDMIVNLDAWRSYGMVYVAFSLSQR